MRSHDIFQSCDQKRAYRYFQGKKKLTWDTVKSAFAFTYGSKYSQFSFVSFTGFP